MSQRPNVFTAPTRVDPDDPPGFRGAEAHVGDRSIGAAAGGRELKVRVYDLPAGETLCPYHYETVEEWLLVLDGEVDVRGPEETVRCGRGELVCFPAGPDGAHRVATPADSSAPARLMMFSSGAEPVVAVYPDSDKIGVWVPGGADNLLVRRADAQVDYYEGEIGD